MSTYKLVVSDRIEFDVKFTLNDGGEDKPFGMRLSAQRQLREQQQEDMAAGVKVGDFLKERKVALVAWIGKAPLADEDGNPVPPSPQALEALYDLVGGMVDLVFAGYLLANGARGKSGN
ncbi:MAG: hypothetical protein ACK4F7_01800 [Inhella sp.]